MLSRGSIPDMALLPHEEWIPAFAGKTKFLTGNGKTYLDYSLSSPAYVKLTSISDKGAILN